MPVILIIRLSAIGDIIFASALINALRRAWPNAYLAWLIQAEYRSLLDQHPDLDEVIICPLRHWRELWLQRRFSELFRGIKTLRTILQLRKFTLALDLQGLLKSGILTWLSGAPQRIGLGSREGSQWLMTSIVPRAGESGKIASEYHYFAASLGLPLTNFAPLIYYNLIEAKLILEWIHNKKIIGGYVVLCPFTTRPQKHWLEENWAILATRLWREFRLISIILGGIKDQTGASNIYNQCEIKIINLTGVTSLNDAAALIDRAELLIAVDTGLGHLGIALKKPTILLFGSTCPYLNPGRANARVLYHPRACSPCRRRPQCNGIYSCMRAIEVTEVITCVRELLV